MGTSHRKGYAAEHAVEVLLRERYPFEAEHILRPRAGSSKDVGDIVGLPVVISVKNYVEPRLSGWVNDLEGMCENSGKGVGVVWHKTRGKASPLHWMVTTDETHLGLMLNKTGDMRLHRHFAGCLPAQRVKSWLDVAQREADFDGGAMALLIHKRKGENKPPYVTMTGDTFLRLLDAYMIPTSSTMGTR
jgi:hypothetical protein